MRILMASKRAPDAPGRRPGGVQTWTATVAAELRRLGHEVEIVGASSVPTDGHDVGIFSNTLHTAPWSSRCADVIALSHGIVPDEEPRWIGRGVQAFTSEEVRDHWKGVGPIIRQPIDLDFWSPGQRRAGKTLVRYANRGGLEWLPGVAARLGLRFVHVRNATHEQARDLLRDAACVLASGRCAVEAMACGAPVVVCDDRPYQGPLMERFAPDSMIRNYSGRGGEAPTVDGLHRAILSAMAVGSLREVTEVHHDVRRIVPKILEAACSGW